MVVYLDVVILLNFLVDFLLLLGTNRLCGYYPGFGRTALAAVVGGLYAGTCLLPGFHFLANTLWRVVSLCIISWLAFGFSKSALRRGAVFVLLSMALGGVCLGLGDDGIWSVVLAAAAISVICFIGFREKIGSTSFVPVVLRYGANQVHITALKDSGNQLKDPLTGNPVLVVAADVAERLTGLTQQQLSKPSEAVLTAKVPGLRLIPYHTVGSPNGMLLGLRMQDVKIGKWKGSSLVAFAPEGLSKEGAYQALTGGAA
ncbi:MAG: sigma-E processing peptidase SpoIIGA [Oscillospiraceae bacterium]|nr:sigma-E processing peptidase SpoIIGA [Oscillospiraceae bacterium]